MTGWTHQTFDNIHHFLSAYRRGARPRLHFTKHFVGRMQQMKVTEDELFTAIKSPEYIGFSDQYKCVNLSAGRITISVRLDSGGHPDAVTLQWWNLADWEDAERAGNLGKGRTIRLENFARR